jgi:cytochrome P450 family 9
MSFSTRAFIFFFAGFDTVATTMGFMGYELAVNPEVQQKLFEEIQESEANLNGKWINYEQIQALKYLDQVVCETLRKWPAAPVRTIRCLICFIESLNEL